MARRIVGPRLEDQLGIGPMDDKQAGELRKLIESLTWAIDRAAELHNQAWEERQRDREVVAR